MCGKTSCKASCERLESVIGLSYGQCIALIYERLGHYAFAKRLLTLIVRFFLNVSFFIFHFFPSHLFVLHFVDLCSKFSPYYRNIVS